MPKYAYEVSVFDHATQQTHELKVIVEIEAPVPLVGDFKLNITETVPNNLQEAGFYHDLKKTMGDQFAELLDPLDEIEDLEFDGEFGGHFCEVTFQAVALKEDDDGE